MDRESIGQIESFSMDQEAVKKLSRRTSDISMDRNCVNFCREMKKKGLNRCESIELEEKVFFKEKK